MYKYDQDEIHVNVQEGGSSTEVYVHAYDHKDEAEKAARQTEGDSYNILAEESLTRSALEKAALHLYAGVKELLEVTEPSTVAGDSTRQRLRQALIVAEKDVHLRDILKQCNTPVIPASSSNELVREALNLMGEMMASLRNASASKASVQFSYQLEDEWRWQTIKYNLIKLMNL